MYMYVCAETGRHKSKQNDSAGYVSTTHLYFRAQQCVPQTFRFVTVSSNAVYLHRVLQIVSCLRTGLFYPLQIADEGLEVGQGPFGQELRGVFNFCMHDQWG